MTTILLTAAEPSGDAMGTALMRALREMEPDITFIGAGGVQMRGEGLRGDLPTEKLAVMGPVDALAAWPRARSIVSGLNTLAAQEKPDAAVLIDSWSFSRMVADGLRKSGITAPMIKLAAPQVWASRPKRAEAAAELFDRILCLLPFEPQYFEEAGGSATFIGNPNFRSVASQERSAEAFRTRYELGDEPVLICLPGSRGGEVKRLMPVFGTAVTEIVRRVPGVRPVIVAADNVADAVATEAEAWSALPLIVPSAERFDAYAAADVALAASGTVSTELAICETPMVIGYILGPVTAFWARRVVTTPYISVINVAEQAFVIPERVQEECRPEQLAADVIRLFTDDEARRQQLSAFRRILPTILGTEDPAELAAREVLSLVHGENRGDLDSSAAGE
ncbi:MAG: lipid-A-disaccharide synthase [Pseudomonadota bacterium]